MYSVDYLFWTNLFYLYHISGTNETEENISQWTLIQVKIFVYIQNKYKILRFLHLYTEYTPLVTFLKTIFLADKWLSIYFGGLTLEIQDCLEVKTSKLAFMTKRDGKRWGESTEVFPLSSECKKCV